MAKKPPKYNLDDLLKLTRRLFPTRFKNAPEANTRLKKLIYTPFVGTKLLAIRGEVTGLAEDKIYKVIITFQNVDYVDAEDATHSVRVPVGAGTNKTVWMAPLKKKNEIKFRCGCLDSYFTSLYYAWQTNNIYGVKPRKYTRKTPPPPAGYPERNPAHEPILCKHLLSVMTRIRKSKYYMGGV